MKKNLLIFLLSVVWGLAGASDLTAGGMKTFLNQSDRENWTSISLNSFGNEWNYFHSFDFVTNKTLNNSHLFQSSAPDWLELPTLPCYFGNGGTVMYFEDAYAISNTNQYLAAPFVVEYSQAFDLQQIKMSIVSESDINSANLKLYNSSDVFPSSQIYSTTMAPSSQVIMATFSDSNLKIYEITFNLPTTISFDSGKYFFAANMTNTTNTTVYWETTGTYNPGGTMSGNDSSWIGPWEDMVYYLAGSCQDLGLCSAVNVPYLEDFNSTSIWDTPNCTVIETIAPSNSWIVSDDPDAFPTNHLVYSFSETNDGNSWFITRGVNLTAGTNYTISYDFLAASSYYPESMTVKMGTSANAAGMTTLLKNHSSITNEIPITETINFTVSSSGVYYFGFHANSPADRFNLYLDNIKVEQGYVEPSYCEPIMDCTDGDLMTNVTFKEIDNTTTCSQNGYGDFTNLIATVNPGSSNNISVTVGGGWDYESVSVWIDYDNSLTFDEDEFIFIGSGNNSVVQGSINIPTNVAVGDYRMRVRVHAATPANATWDLACELPSGNNYGETEDYTIRVIDTFNGCLDVPNGQWPLYTISPVCIGGPIIITDDGYYGEYSLVAVNSNTEYIFSTNSNTAFITISNEIGTEVLAFGVGSITWTATDSTNVRFIVHENENCDFSSSFITRMVQCGDVSNPIEITEPDFPCFQGDGLNSNGFENGIYINFGFLAVDDFIVEEDQTFEVQQLRFNFFSDSEIAASTIRFYSDNNNQPGTIQESITMAPSSQRLIGYKNGNKIYEVTYNLANSIVLEEGRYWINPEIHNDNDTHIVWEGTSTGSNGLNPMLSTDNGNNWIASTGNFQTVFFIAGICEDVEDEEPIVITEPDFPCFQGDGLASYDFYAGMNIHEGNYSTADDFFVEEDQTFTVQQIRMNVFSVHNITNAVFNIAEDNSGIPGTIVSTFTLAPTSSRIIGNNFGLNVHELTFDLTSPIDLTEGHYWLIPTLTNTENTEVFWEVTPTGTLGEYVLEGYNNNTQWYGFGTYHAVFFISGICEEVEEPTEGCLNTPNGQYPYTNFTPSCIGTVEIITNEGFYGEYSAVNVTEGTEYIFSTDDSNGYITLSDSNGTVVLAYGTGSVTWTATENASIRFIVHLNDECDFSYDFVTRMVQCGEISSAPENDDCQDAIAVSCGDTVTGSTFAAIDSGGNISGDVFYTFTGNGTAQVVTLSLCNSSFDTFLRVFTDCTLTNEIAYNDDACGAQSQLIFESDGTSTYFIMVEGYSSYVGDFELQVSCQDPIIITEPDFPCFQGDGLASNDFENGYDIFGGEYDTADDFIVEENQIFKVQQIRMNVFSNNTVTNAVFEFASDYAGYPGNIESTLSMAPTSSRILGSRFGYEIHELTFDLTTPIEFTEGTYWLIPTLTNVGNSDIYWEITSAGTHGSSAKTRYNNGSWSEGGTQTVFFISGICEDIEEPIEITEPDFPCFQGDGLASNDFQGGYDVFGGSYRTADDFMVAEGQIFKVQQIRMNVFSGFNVTNTVFEVASDNAGVPGNVESTITMMPTSSRIIGYNYGYDIHELTFDLVTPIEFTEGTYWLIPTLTNEENREIYWEITTEGSHGGFTKESYAGGSWINIAGGGYQAVFFISGICEEMEEPTEGCLDTPYDQYPFTTYTPSCLGVEEIITDEGFYGEYSAVNVTEGNEYIFSTDNPTAFITISDEFGETVLAYGTGSVTWTATETTEIRFIVHLDEECNYIDDWVVRMVQCGEIVPPPANDDCANAIAVSCGDSVSGQTLTATNSGGNAAADVFYTFTGAGIAQNVTLSLCESDYDTVIRVFTDCTLTNEIDYNDDACGAQSELIFESDGTSTYYIMVEGWSTNAGNFVLNVSCENIDEPIEIEVPDFPCYQGDGLASQNFNGYGIFSNYRTADDFNVPTGEIFTVQQIRMNVIAPSEISTMRFDFRENTGGNQPGDILETMTLNASDVRYLGVFNENYNLFELTFNIDSPITFNAGKYWLSPVAINNSYVYWEFSTIGTNGSMMQISDVEGNVWSEMTGQNVFFISGVCEEDIQPEDPGCLDTPNGQYPSGSFTPSCNGSTEVITNSGWFGEFSMVNVTEGTEYIFSTDVSTAFITIANASGDTVITSGTGSVTWTATMAGQVRFITHENDDCLSSSNWVERYIQCGEPYVFDDPDYACFQGDGSISAVEDGFGIEATDIYRVADDFTVEPGTEFTLRQVTMSLLSATGVTSATFRIHADNAGLPGAEMHNFTLTPSYNEIYGTAFGFNQHRVEFELSTPITLGEGTYWLSVTTPNLTYWIMSSSGTSGSLTANSNNSGTSWSLNTYGYRAVFYVEGDCDEVVEEPIEGCLDTPNGQYPSTAYTPSCNGSTEVITNSGWFGEFSMVSVTAGTEYIFSTDVSTAFITIANASGDTVITSGTGSVTWTATMAGQVRFITHENDDCLSSSNWVERYIQCGEPYVFDDPDYACFQGDGSISAVEDGFGIEATDIYRVADDFTVEPGTEFTLRQVTMSLLSATGVTSATFRIHADNAGLPGAEMHNFTLTPSYNEIYGTAFGFNQHRVEFELSTPITLGEGTYWLSVTTPNLTYWIMSSSGTSGSLTANSNNSGTSWSLNTYGYRAVFYVEGDCDEVVEEPIEGCLDTPNGQYPSTAYTPSCNGTTEVITDLGWFGEFSMVSVTAGTEYIFSTDVATAFITIANAAGDTVITSGTGSVTWTATMSGQVRFITHENDDCLSSSNWVERYVQCGEIVPPPPYDPCAPIHEGIATNGVGFVNNGTDNYMAANDFNVLMNTQFEVEKFTINVVTLGGEPTTFDLKFFEGDTAVGAQFGETLTNVTPSAITPNGTFGTTGYPVYSVEITLPNSIIFPATATADKKYWVGMSGMPTASGNPVYWESSDYLYTDTLPTWQSADGGTTWAVFSPSVEGDMIIDGECATLGLSDMSGYAFSYYPNPVKDFLKIDSSEPIESISVFNLAGQELMSKVQLTEGKINMKELSPGTYVFRVILKGGKVETFKIIKQNQF